MKVIYFAHSFESCWNNGNAHFLRGIMRALAARGHLALACEPAHGWSRENLVRDHGAAALDPVRASFADVHFRAYADRAEVAALIDGADLVVVHEWNEPWLVAALGEARRRGGRFVLLFHDTHHRALSDPQALRRLDLDAYDGVLAFGAALAEVYRRWGWGDRAFTWHEAADVALFRPLATPTPRDGLVWIGNWGDDERSTELRTFLLQPARASGLPLTVHGVRYPEPALALLAEHGADYAGWLPNALVPEVFARHLATVHVPRRYYADLLPGIPTIRVFEALACGIPLVSAPWTDSENLFRPGEDFLPARNEAEATRHLAALRDDADLRTALVAHGLDTIRGRHSCGHRVDELLAVTASIAGVARPVGMRA